MATNTSNINLVKPTLNEYFNLDIQNGNMDIIDTEIKEVNDKLESQKEDIESKEDILPVERKRKLTFGTTTPNPLLMEEGEVYFQYE